MHKHATGLRFDPDGEHTVKVTHNQILIKRSDKALHLKCRRAMLAMSKHWQPCRLVQIGAHPPLLREGLIQTNMHQALLVIVW